jgi:hypothetical protein
MESSESDLKASVIRTDRQEEQHRTRLNNHCCRNRFLGLNSGFNGLDCLRANLNTLLKKTLVDCTQRRKGYHPNTGNKQLINLNTETVTELCLAETYCIAKAFEHKADYVCDFQPLAWIPRPRHCIHTWIPRSCTTLRNRGKHSKQNPNLNHCGDTQGLI